MQIKEVKPINFLFHICETRVDELPAFIEQNVAGQVQKSALGNDMRIAGPVYWNYFGFTGDEQKPFMLEIAVPVDTLKADYTGSFQQRRSENFRCVSAIHEGGWPRIPETYSRMFAFIAENGLKANGMGRELYIHADFQNPEASITEIQIGVE